MAIVDRRQFLKAGAVAAAGMRNANTGRGLSPFWGSAAPAGIPPGPAPSRSEKNVLSGNLIAHGDAMEGAIGSLPEGWSVVAGNPALRPSFKLVSSEGGKRELMAEGNGRKECYGYVRIPVRLAGGKTYRLRVRFRFAGLEDVNRHLVHGVFAKDALKFNNGIFEYRKEGDWGVGEARFPGPPKDLEAEVRLYFRYSATGKAWWDQVALAECDPIPSRPVKVAVSWGAGGLKHWTRWLDVAGARGADVALMPELFNEIFDPMKAEPEDGPSRRLMAAKARQWKMHVCGTTYVRRGDLVFNTAPLFNREGKLIGSYDKVMLFEPELDLGATPGEELPVFQTDVGKIGIITCYDSWFPETTQMLALKGAELALLPNEGYYTEIMHARSSDNCLAIAVSPTSTPFKV